MMGPFTPQLARLGADKIGSQAGRAWQSRTELQNDSPGLGAMHSRAGGTPWGRQKLRRYAPLLRLCSSRVPSAAPLTTKSSSGLRKWEEECRAAEAENVIVNIQNQGTRVCSAAVHSASQASPQGMRCKPTNGRAGAPDRHTGHPVPVPKQRAARPRQQRQRLPPAHRCAA